MSYAGAIYQKCAYCKLFVMPEPGEDVIQTSKVRKVTRKRSTLGTCKYTGDRLSGDNSACNMFVKR